MVLTYDYFRRNVFLRPDKGVRAQGLNTRSRVQAGMLSQILFSAYVHDNVIEPQCSCLPSLAVCLFVTLDIQKHHSSLDQSRSKRCVQILLKEHLYKGEW